LISRVCEIELFRAVIAGVSPEPRIYGFAVGRGVAAGEAAGVVVPAGKTPAPESGAAEAPGEALAGVVPGDETGEGFADAGEL